MIILISWYGRWRICYENFHLKCDRKTFFDGADIFNALRVNIIFSAPVTSKLPPEHTENNFEHCYTLAPVPIASEKKKRKEDEGLDTLLKFIDLRIDTKRLFTSNTVIEFLARMSGGFYRDFLLLIYNA